MLIDHMSEGYSYESFAGVIGVDRTTLYNWENKHDAFFNCKKKAMEACLLFWERLMITAAQGITKGVSAALIIFTFKCRFGYNDRLAETKIGESLLDLIVQTQKDRIQQHEQTERDASNTNDETMVK